MSIKVRKAHINEIDWVNSQYREIGFVLSDIHSEYIAVAEMNGQKCGLGRLTIIDDTNLELGGMYILKEYQGLGVAKAVVTHLLEESDKRKNIWCLPFKHLLEFYQKFDFKHDLGSIQNIPQKVLEKHQWCNNTYDTEVLLLIKTTNESY